jgi:hypothetical protein
MQTSKQIIEAMNTTFKIGDRVHFREVPGMTGTIKEISDQGKFAVAWDMVLNENEVAPPNKEKLPFYPKQHLRPENAESRQRGNPNFSNRKTNPAVIASNNHPVFPGLSCNKPATVQIPEKAKNAIAKPDGTGIDEDLYRKIQFLIRKHALKSSGAKSWEEFKNDAEGEEANQEDIEAEMEMYEMQNPW